MVLQGLFAQHPEIPTFVQTMILAGVATFAVGLDIAKPDVTEMWKELDENTPGWKKDLADSPEFQQAFLLTLEAIARTRNQNKRRLIRLVFLNEYIPAEDRERISIERFYRAIQEISIEAMEHLLFIKKTILPRKKQMVLEEVAAMNKTNRAYDDEWWYRRNMDRMPESQVIEKWIYEEYNVNSPNIKRNKPPDHTPEWEEWMHKHSDEEYSIRKQFGEFRSELLSLGIMIQRQDYDGNYSLTEFGKHFLEYVNHDGEVK